MTELWAECSSVLSLWPPPPGPDGKLLRTPSAFLASAKVRHAAHEKTEQEAGRAVIQKSG